MNWSNMNTSFMTVGLSFAHELWVKNQTEKLEKLLSRFNPNSDVSRFNRGETPQSPTFWHLLQKALFYFEVTEGMFQPFLGQVLSQLGYNESFENLNPIRQEQVKRAGTTGALDFGGIAKGWTGQACFERLYGSGVSSGLIDAGGDIVLWGLNNNAPWVIGLASPKMDTPLACLTFHISAGIATSSTQKRQWQLGEHHFHHLVDPYTRTSSQSDCIQATVLAPSLTDADVYAKVLLLKGCLEGPAWLKEHRPDLAYIMVRCDDKVLVSPNITNYCSKIE